MLLRMAGAIALSCVCGNASATYGFDPVVALAPKAVGATSIAIGDVTGDGREDVVALGSGSHAFYRGRIVVYAQQAAGGFAAPVTHAFSDNVTSDLPRELALADLDADGSLDIVVSYERNFEYRLALLRNAGGQFTINSYSSSARNEDLRFTDVDQDGNLDIVARSWPGQARVYFGNGIGGIRGDASYSMGVSFSPWHLRDMDNDGRRDIVYATSGGIVMQRNENGGFSTSARRLLGPALSLGNFAVGDFNGDGRMDIAGISSNSWRGQIEVFLQDRNGGYRRSRSLEPNDFASYGRIVAQDMDGDGHDDLVASRFGSVIDVYVVRPSGFARRSFIADDAQLLAFGDLNQDGRADIAMANGSVSLLMSRGAPIENDLAVFMGLVPNAVALRVENVGALPSTSYSLSLHVDARVGTLAFGTMPPDCWAYAWQGYTEITCYQQPSLAAGEHRTFAFPFTRSPPGSRNTLIASGRISVTPDLRQDNNVVFKRLEIPAAAAAPGQASSALKAMPKR